MLKPHLLDMLLCVSDVLGKVRSDPKLPALVGFKVLVTQLAFSHKTTPGLSLRWENPSYPPVLSRTLGMSLLALPAGR